MKSSPFFTDKRREYLQCTSCALVFVPRSFHLSTEEEKAVYDLHQNSPVDLGYRRFLSRLSEPMTKRLPPHKSGLDFGCGPGPVLSLMIEEAGHNMTLYDPYYFDDPSTLTRSYNFITATEVVEHLSDPGLVFSRLFTMLEDGGYLGLMTKLVISPEAFSRWHYIHDETHICFYSRETFEYISELYNADLEFIGNDVILMKKASQLE
jgi:hypothetical protein